MVMDTDNFLRAAKNKDIMTTRRYHCRASILYFLHCNFTRPRKKIVSWVSELHTKKNCTLEKPMRVGYYVMLLKAEQTVGDKRNIKYKIWKRWFKECTTFLQCTLNTATQYEKQTIEK